MKKLWLVLIVTFTLSVSTIMSCEVLKAFTFPTDSLSKDLKVDSLSTSNDSSYYNLGVSAGIGRHQGIRLGLSFGTKWFRTGCGYGIGFTALGIFIAPVDVEFAYSGFIELPTLFKLPLGIGISFSNVYKLPPLGYSRDYLGVYLTRDINLGNHKSLLLGLGVDKLMYSKYPVILTATYQLHIDVKFTYNIWKI